MSPPRLFWIFVLALLALSACSTAPGAAAAPEGDKGADPAPTSQRPDTSLKAVVPESCPVTLPPKEPFTPPKPHPVSAPYDGQFWFGSDSLWTMLPKEGVWAGLPVGEDGGRPQKIFWWREGYEWQEEPQPKLTLTARLLDGKSGPLAGERATHGYHQDLGSFMLSGADFPSAGCWEITGAYSGESLSFVVWIAP